MTKIFPSYVLRLIAKKKSFPKTFERGLAKNISKSLRPSLLNLLLRKTQIHFLAVQLQTAISCLNLTTLMEQTLTVLYASRATVSLVE